MDDKALKQRLRKHGLQDRPTQSAMFTAIKETLLKKNILCVEAPTGTGKTLAYSLAALLARKPKQHVVISTATIALQSQLTQKDIPQIQAILQQDLTIALAKGRRRYVCHARLYDTDDTQSDLLNSTFNTTPLKDMLSNHDWDGDRDNLSVVVPQQDWQRISTDAAGCSGRHCNYFEECAFFKARRQQQRAEVIVANHSLLLADLQLGGGVILPKPEQCIYIIDECHHLPEQAISHFSHQASIMGSIDWINQLTKTVHATAKLGEIDASKTDTLQPLTQALVAALKSMDDALQSQQHKFDRHTWQPNTTDINSLLPLANTIRDSAKHLFQHSSQLQQQLEDKITHREKQKLPPDDALIRIHRQMSFVTGRAQNLMLTWQTFCRERQANEAPTAKWFTNDKQFQCHTAPINVSDTLNTTLWSRCQLGAICCSATIRSMGQFDDYLRRSGLKQHTHCQTKVIDSPFDYSQSCLYVPTMQYAPQGSEQQAHHAEALALIKQLILPTGGTLVLFTSLRAMEQTYDDLPDDIALQVLMQTHHSKKTLIEKHHHAVHAGQRSILFGLASLGEGLDLPAELCQHVIIHKLPFAVPTTPIEKTRNDWLVTHKKNPFMLSTLPHATLRLTQYVGRLIRRDTDTGIISVLDKRLYTKPYGQKIIKSLPNFQKLVNKQPTELFTIMSSLFDKAPEAV